MSEATDSGRIVRDPETNRLVVEGQPVAPPVPTLSATAKPPANGSLVLLFVLGSLFTAAGIIGAFVAKAMADSAASYNTSVSEFEGALEGSAFSGGAISPDYTVAWVWAVIGAVGILMLIAGIAVRAAKS